MYQPDILADKTILVTGGGSGLGLSMARRFAELGGRVAICGRSQDRLDKARQELAQSGYEVTTHAVDVRDYDAVGEMFTRLVDRLGPVNGLVNSAAGNFLAASEDLSPKGFKAVVDIVLHGTFNCTQHLGQQLISNKQSGTILNIVTTYASGGCGFVLPSACAKAGVLAMTQSLAFEWADYNIRINAIAPGPFPTEGAWSRLMPNQDFEDQYKARIPAGRYGEHWELANLAVFLMSELSPYLTGDCITIDGGERLQAGMFNYLAQMAPRAELRKIFKNMRSGASR